MGSLNDIINGKANKEKKTGMKRGSTVMIPIDLLVPNEDNRRSFGDRERRNIDVLAEELLISGRVLENLLVRKMDDGQKYLILSGHRRYYASKLNARAGHEGFLELPCEVTEESDAMSYFNLLIANLSTEPLTEHEKMTSTMHLKNLLPELLGDDDLKGRKLREKIAETLHISQTKVAQYENISNHLVDDAMGLFENQKMNVSTANDLAGLPEDVQKEFVKDGTAPVMSDVRTVKQELKTIGSYSQMSEHEKKDAALILNDLLLNTDLKKYRDAMEKFGKLWLSGGDGGEAYAAEIAGMLLHYRDPRQFIGKNAAMYIFRARRVEMLRYSSQDRINLRFSYRRFFSVFCEVYREVILNNAIAGEEPRQMEIDDYDKNDPYEQIIPEKGSCDGKCFNCRNTACNSYREPRDKCLFFKQIDCTVRYVFGNLKKDSPDLYEKCIGCCMRCTVSDACSYACNRKDMSIIRERAGIQDAPAEEKSQSGFAIPKEEEVAAVKSLLSKQNANRAYLYLKDTPSYEINLEKFSGLSGFLDCLKSERKPGKDELAAHPCWIRSEAAGKGQYKACYAFGELTNVQEIMYDIHTVIEILRRSVAVGYFGDDEEMRFVRYGPQSGEEETFVEEYPKWEKWFELPQIGAVYYRVVLDDGCQIAAAAYENDLGSVCYVVYYYVSRFDRINNVFNTFEISKEDLIGELRNCNKQ